MSDRIFTYWEGKKPWWIGLCLKSLQDVYQDRLVILDPKTLGNYIDLDKIFNSRWKEIPTIAPRVTLYRVALIHKYGGWWFDADTVAISQPPTITDKFLYTKLDGKPYWVPNAAFGSPKGHVLINDWLEGINQIISSAKKFQMLMRSPWLVFGPKIITPLVDSKPNTCQLIPRKRLFPLDVSHGLWDFLNPGTIESYLEKDTVCFGLVHSFLQEKAHGLLKMKKEDRKGSFILLHSILNYLEERYG